DEVEEDAADERAERLASADRGDDDPQRPRAVRAVEASGDERGRQRRDGSRADPLQQSRADDELEGGGDRGEEAAEPEQEDPGHERRNETDPRRDSAPHGRADREG